MTLYAAPSAQTIKTTVDKIGRSNKRFAIICTSVGAVQYVSSVAEINHKFCKLITFRRFMEDACMAYPKTTDAECIEEDMSSLCIAYDKLLQKCFWQDVLRASYDHIIMITVSSRHPFEEGQHNTIDRLANIIPMTKMVI